ncbi:MAG TPA: ABC transporter permease [Bryobacteraceae bacterium]|nr:ABC transporter permease [Bryobacteraceae bacterium]
MSSPMPAAIAVKERHEASQTSLAMTAFFAILVRDLVVTRREIVSFLLQAMMQPLFFLFIFGKVLPGIGLAAGGFAGLLLPGIVSLSGMLAAIQGVTLPLVLDLGFAREIDDRLLAPLPVWMVAAEKVLFGTFRGAFASACIFPMAVLILGSSYSVRTDRMGMLILMILLNGLVGAAIGMLIGTLVQPQFISLMFTLIFTPLIFTGCAYYPWTALGHIRWFQVLTLLNPLTYCSEGLRYAMVPPTRLGEVPTLDIRIVLAALIVGFAACFIAGTRTFHKRVVS